MKLIVSLLLILAVKISTGQDNIYQFVITEFNTDGTVYKSFDKTVESQNKQIDLYFYNEYFHAPYLLPENFLDESHKNDTVTLWHDEKAKKDFGMNWTNTYIYDSLSRLISYSFSGCMVCSRAKYNYKVIYNKTRQITGLINDVNGFRAVDSYEMKYDSIGNLAELKVSYYNKLTKEIKMK